MLRVEVKLNFKAEIEVCMPELPEVESFKRYMNSTSLHKPIDAVEVRSNLILEDVTPDKLEKSLVGQEFLSCQRYGKYLFTDVNREFWLAMHFGMTGNLKYFKDTQDDPKHDRLLISFKNGFHLAFDCQRKFGRVATTSAIEDFVKRKKLGKDALAFDFDSFKDTMRKKRGTAKYTLMNQRAIAGIGNLYSDEIMFQTGVHPKTKVADLDDETLKALFNNMRRILRTAIRNKAHFNKLPKDYLIPNRLKGAECPRCGAKIQTLKVSGRTAYFCSKHQKAKKHA
jgi:formamidopyrimidine-DNA glycosylase